MQENVELLRLTTAGSVDDGKSTLIGRLLFDSDAVFKDQLDSVAEVSLRKGKEELDLALLLDGLSAEREQGITIDVAYRYFNTGKRKFIIADTPGHEQYTRNMVTGASTANVAIVLVDARKGMLKQSKRHLFIASLLKIPHVLVVVNKMDQMDYNQEVFERIKQDFVEYSAKLNIQDLRFVPISALKGDMVVNRGENMDWYQGATVLSYLENLQAVSDRNLIDFRFPVQYVLRPNQNFRGYLGKIEGGAIRPGEEVRILPSGKKAVVKSVLIDGEEVPLAFNPQSVALTLEEECDVSRGDMIVRENNLPKISNQVEANLCWFDENSLEVNKRYIIKHTTKNTPGYVEDLKYVFDVNSLERRKNVDLKLNDIGRVTIRTNDPLIFDVYSKNKTTGSFIVIDEQTNNTVGAGMIISKGKKMDVINSQSQLSTKKGAVLWFTGLSGAGKSTIAEALYGYLKKMGVVCEHLDGDVVRESLCNDLGFSKADRVENIKRVGFVAKMLSKNGVIVLASFISPYRDQRKGLRNEMDNFVEVFVNAPLEVCEARDVKGLYKKARLGEIDSFTGVSDPYEEPENSEISIDTSKDSVDDAVEGIVNYLIDNGFIN